MAKYTPQYDTFKQVLKLDFYINRITWFVFFLSVLTSVLEHFKEEHKYLSLVFLLSAIITFSLFVIEFIISAIRDYYLFPKAEYKRRKDLIDNSLESQYSIKNSKKYFTNNEIEPSIYKLGVNLFQNIHFTNTISEKMRKKEIIKTSIFGFLLIIMAFWGFKNSLIPLSVLQLFFSAFIVGELIKLLLFVQKNRNSIEQLQTFFSSNEKDASIIFKVLLDYESNLAWAGIVLDEDIFNELNESTEKDWEKIKKKYNITNG